MMTSVWYACVKNEVKWFQRNILLGYLLESHFFALDRARLFDDYWHSCSLLVEGLIPGLMTLCEERFPPWNVTKKCCIVVFETISQTWVVESTTPVVTLLARTALSSRAGVLSTAGVSFALEGFERDFLFLEAQMNWFLIAVYSLFT